MKNGIAKALCVLSLSLASVLPSFAEGNQAKSRTEVLVSPNFLGVLVGYYSANAEFRLGDRLSAEIEPGYFNIAAVPLVGPYIKESGFEFWYASCKLGMYYYPNEVFKGFFIGGYGKGGYFSVESGGEGFQAGYAGIGAKAGYRWTKNWASFALGVSYEYNVAFASIPSTSDSVVTAFTSAVDGGIPGTFALFSFAL
jgi:hypothetical protein